jgi:hypothetical protein
MMPHSSASEEIAQRSESLAIKQALDSIEQAKKKKEEICGEITQHLANLSMMDELMKVH